MNIAHWLERAAQVFGPRAAIAHGETLWCDYTQFAERAARAAHWLLAQGLAPGDRVALFMVNRPDYLELLWGVWWAGCVAVPINAKLHPREAAWIARHSGARLLLSDADRAAATQAALLELEQATAVHSDTLFLRDAALPCAAVAPRSEDDPAWLFYTSGTTGRPKGVTLGARQLRWSAMGYLSHVQAVAAGDAMLHPAPLSHGGGIYHLPYVLHGGLNVVPASGGFDTAECLALAAHWGRASFFAAPTMVRRLVDTVKRSGRRPEGLQTIVYGGGPMYLADITEALQVVGPHFAQIYGQGECPMSISVLPRALINDSGHPRWRERLASVGHAFAMVEMAVRGADGQALPAGESGEVCVRGDVVMNGYWHDAAASAAALQNGWLATGDVGRIDGDGFLTLLDRSKDLVVSGGSNIYPREVEEALLTHPQVLEVSVIGRPDAEWGEVVVAYVVVSGALSAAELDAHCLEQIARFKRPKHYCFIAELPKNHYGKVLKTALRETDAAIQAGEKP